jgi:hypothetical protein
MEEPRCGGGVYFRERGILMVVWLREREYGAVATSFHHIGWVETQLIALVEPN